MNKLHIILKLSASKSVTLHNPDVQNIKSTLQNIKMTIKYKLIQILVIGLILLTVSCGQRRDKDIDEIVLSEKVIEKNGIYYKGDCEIHAKEKFSGECKFYHNNNKFKGVVHIENGLPTGHWQYWDTTGIKILDIYFEKGRLIKKEKPVPEPNYPWTKNVTKIATKAILTSIQNIKTDSSYQGDFPTNIYNMPFIRIEKTDFVIVGYETATSKPEYLKINYHPKNEYQSGPRFTVEMNILTEQAIKVYMTPDA